MKVYPIGFVEYLFDDDGNKKVLGPFTESDEAEECDKWNVRLVDVSSVKAIIFPLTHCVFGVHSNAARRNR